MSLMILPCYSTKQPEKLDGFVDDPKAEKDPDMLGKVYRKSTYVFSRLRSYDHNEKVDPFHSSNPGKNFFKKKKR